METIKTSFSIKEKKKSHCWNVSFSNYTVPGMPLPLVCFNAVAKLQPTEVVMLHFWPHRATETWWHPTCWLRLQAGTYIHRLLSDINYASIFLLELQLDVGLCLSRFHLTQVQQF